MGYQSSLTKVFRSPSVIVPALTFSAVTWLVLDLDRPGEGFVRVSQEPMISSSQSGHPIRQNSVMTIQETSTNNPPSRSQSATVSLCDIAWPPFYTDLSAAERLTRNRTFRRDR
jgi:hypothetical protein